MGIALTGIIALVDLHRRFGPFGRTVQIGRQGLFVVDHERPWADLALREQGIGESLAAIAGSDHYADEHLLPRFGADPIDAADASDYEGATIIHDFNSPIGQEHHGQYDTLIDFGSLEHIFNVPVALANMMKMLKIGGRLVSIAPSNNWLGHGFYQIGPELPFRVYQPENGFELLSVKLFGVQDVPMELTDKGAAGVRNEFGYTRQATDLVTIARKTAEVEPFRRWPQQGDYAHIWDASAG
jgi:hypothetical protein